MFKSVQNYVRIHFRLVPNGPILVRAQNVGLDPGAADMEFHRTTRNGRRTVFLAGSGLKGAVRSHVERLLRSGGRFACDPTKTKWEHRDTCGHSSRKLGVGTSRRYRHAGQCAACYTFGSLKLAGRFRIGDAFPTDEAFELTNLTEVRAGVGIERQSQGAADGVLYDTEVVVQGGFGVTISGESFSLWQVGVILQALEDFHQGFVQIGGCKSRGMGTIQVEDLAVQFHFLNDEDGLLTGATNVGQHNYGLPELDRIEVGAATKAETVGSFRRVTYNTDGISELRNRLLDGPYAAYLAGAEG